MDAHQLRLQSVKGAVASVHNMLAVPQSLAPSVGGLDVSVQSGIESNWKTRTTEAAQQPTGADGPQRRLLGLSLAFSAVGRSSLGALDRLLRSPDRGARCGSTI